MTILEELDGYDWAEVFGEKHSEYSYGPEHNDAWIFVALDGTNTVSEDAVKREDVSRILWIQEGENDGPDWQVLAELKDGRSIFAEGGCDYTGWDCQSSVRRFVSNSSEALLRWAMTPAERAETGL